MAIDGRSCIAPLVFHINAWPWLLLTSLFVSWRWSVWPANSIAVSRLDEWIQVSIISRRQQSYRSLLLPPPACVDSDPQRARCQAESWSMLCDLIKPLFTADRVHMTWTGKNDKQQQVNKHIMLKTRRVTSCSALAHLQMAIQRAFWVLIYSFTLLLLLLTLNVSWWEKPGKKPEFPLFSVDKQSVLQSPLIWSADIKKLMTS